MNIQRPAIDASEGSSRQPAGDHPELSRVVSAAGAIHRLGRVGVWVAGVALVAAAGRAVLVSSLGVSLFWIVAAVVAAAAVTPIDRMCRSAISRCDAITAAARAERSAEDGQRGFGSDYDAVKTYLTTHRFYVNPRYAFHSMKEMRRYARMRSSLEPGCVPISGEISNFGLIPAGLSFWVRWSPTGVLVDQVMTDLERESPELLRKHRYRRRYHTAAATAA